MAAAPQNAAPASAWITGKEAVRRLPNGSYYRLARFAALGRVKLRVRPGVPVFYDAADVEKVAAELREGPV